VGSLHGYSAIGMAMAGATVTAVDPHTGGGQVDSWEAFQANLALCPDDVRDRVEPVKDTIEHYLTTTLAGGMHTGDRRWDMAFIDGDHAGEAPYRQGQLAAFKLEGPKILAFHDCENYWPDVDAGVRKLRYELNLELLDSENSLRVFRVHWPQSVPG